MSSIIGDMGSLLGIDLRSAFLLFPALLCAQPHVDLLLRGGQVIDGSGIAGRSAEHACRSRIAS